MLKTSLDEEKTLGDVLNYSIGASNSLRIDDEVFDWAAINGDKKRFTFTEDR